jgi:hypothetical protein
VRADAAQRPAKVPPALLVRVERADAGRSPLPARDQLVSVMAGHLLDDVRLPRDVGTERRHRDLEHAAVRAARGEADRLQVAPHRHLVEVRPEQGVHPPGAHRDPQWLGRHRPCVEQPAEHQRRRGAGLPRRPGEDLEVTHSRQLGHLRVTAPLEAHRGLRAQAEAARRAGDGERHEVGSFQHYPRGGGGDLGLAAAHHPAHAYRPAGGVGDQAVRRQDGTLDAVEGGDPLALAPRPRHEPSPQQVEVVGVGGLAELEHHVVGGIDDRVDRAHPAEQQPARDLGRRGHGGHTGDHPRREPRAELGRLDGDRGEARRRLAGGRHQGLRQLERQPQLGRQVSCHAGDAEAVRAVRRHVEVEHHVGHDAERLDDRGARSGTAGAEHQQPLGVVGDPQLAARAEHPLGDHPAHLAPADLEPAGENGADRGQRHPVADREVPGTADDGELSVAGVDGHVADAVGAVDGGDPEHLGDHDRLEAGPDPLEPVDDQPERREGGGQLGGAGLHGRHLAQPGEWDSHRCSGSSRAVGVREWRVRCGRGTARRSR